MADTSGMRTNLAALALLTTTSLAVPATAQAEPADGALTAFAGGSLEPVRDAQLGAVAAGAGAGLRFALDQPQLALPDPWFDYREAKYRAASPKEASVASILEQIAAMVAVHNAYGIGLMTDANQGQTQVGQFAMRTIELPQRELSFSR